MNTSAKNIPTRQTPEPHVIDFRYAPIASWTCLGRPDDSCKTIAREDGALLYEFNREYSRSPVFFHRVIGFGLLTDRSPVEIHQATESGRSAILVTTLRYPKATLTLRAFGHQHDGDRRTDIVLWSIQLTQGVQELLTGLWLSIQQPGYCHQPRNYPKSDQMIRQVRCENGPWPVDQPTGLAEGKLSLRSVPQPLRAYQAPGFGPYPGLATDLVMLREGQTLQGAIVIPLNHESVDNVDGPWIQNALATERRFWDEFPLRKIALDISDRAVTEMIDASARNILQAREIKEGLPEFQVGPTFYRGQWVADGHFLLEAARYLGLAEDADRGIDTVLRRARPNGALTQSPESTHHKETAISLATLVRQTELCGNWDRLRAAWPTVQNAVKYIQQLRREACELPVSSPAHGLLPPSFADGGLGGLRPEYTTALWTLAGLKHVVRAAQFLGLEADAALFENEFESLLTDFRAHAQRDMGKLADDTPYLPMCMPGGSSDSLLDPDFQGTAPVWERVNPGTGTWALCHAIYPGEVFAPDDPLVKNLLHLFELIDDEEEIPSGTGWMPYQAVWPYYASFAAHVWLYADRPDKAADYLYGFANHAAPTRVWREEQFWRNSHHVGNVSGDMPHNWASAEFIRLVRDLLVFERGSELELLYGLPPEWVVPGKCVRVERTPTRFGPVTVEMALDESGQGQVVVERDVHWVVQPRTVRLHLPAKVNLRSVRLNESPSPVDDHRHIILPTDPRTTVQFRL